LFSTQALASSASAPELGASLAADAAKKDLLPALAHAPTVDGDGRADPLTDPLPGASATAIPPLREKRLSRSDEAKLEVAAAEARMDAPSLSDAELRAAANAYADALAEVAAAEKAEAEAAAAAAAEPEAPADMPSEVVWSDTEADIDESDEEMAADRESLHDRVRVLLSETFRGFTSAGDGGMFIDKNSNYVFGDTYRIGPPGLPEPGMTPEERALLLEHSREEKMRRDFLLAMVLTGTAQDPPFLVKKLIRTLRIAGWRVINKHWHAAINHCISAGSVRASLRDDGRAFEVFWPK
jgi:hypothetical protein